MPYTDNLYSMVDEDDSDVEPVADHGVQEEPQRHHVLESAETSEGQWQEEDPEHVLSPVDGYFTGTGTSGGLFNIPQVLNVMVRDPTLEPGTTAESKAREARQERSANDDTLDSSSVVDDTPQRVTSPQSSSAYQPTPSITSRSTPYYQPSTATHYSSHSRSTTTSPSYTSYAPRRSIYTQRSPLLPTEAPPAYTPSPTTSNTSPTSPTTSSPDFSRNYQTFHQTMGRPAEAERLLAEPESMGNPPDDEFAHASPTWRDRVRRRVPYLNWKNCRVVSAVLVLLLVTAGFLTMIISGTQEKPQPPQPNDPPSRVIEPPRMDYPAHDGDIPWFPSTAYCSGDPNKHLSLSEPLTFGPDKNLTFKQDVAHPDHDQDDGYHLIQITGDVVLRRSGDGTPDAGIVVDFITNDETLKVALDWNPETQSYSITVPRKLSWYGSVSWPCVAIRATIWVPGDAVLDTLSVGTTHLDIKLLDNLSIQVNDGTRLASIVGRITAATDGTGKVDDLVDDSAPDYFAFTSRWIEAHTISSRITGYWPLYDYLGLATTSGNIKVRIEPKEESPTSPKPAVLNIKSASGTIEFWEPVSKAITTVRTALSAPERYIPPRDYRSNIQSTSGSIRGSMAFSSAARIHTTSGTTEIELLPVLDIDSESAGYAGYASNLETSSTSGTTKIRVLEPLWIDGEGRYLPPSSLSSPSAPPSPNTNTNTIPRPFRCLQSRHSSTSSTLKIEYPGSWEGDLDLGTMSGSLKVSGEGVKVVKAGKGWPGVNMQLLARKGGGGGSTGVVKTVSGSVWVGVGEVVWR